ncbi:hypothetical protein BDQ17DRAFT_1343569 [Cyathus striatus]|nr:hypothetical protein BDQ17DRAFT_1343569 [Cyathus striatus]
MLLLPCLFRPPTHPLCFQEWLLYVEMCPENLYFILWLREYRTRYDQWLSQTKFQPDSDEYRFNWSTGNSSHLAMFYARAKQTFFTPNAIYELNLSSDRLAPFHAANESPHPEPSILKLFVSAQLNNVGNNRVMCGMIAGVLFCLIGFIPPVVVNFVRGHTRWARVTAFPGLWVGLTIFLAAIHGICIGVYIFGDLRQLRKFELARPPISKPKPLPGLRMRPFTPMIPVTPQPVTPTIPRPPRLNIIPPPPPSHPRSDHSLSRTASHMSDSTTSSSSSSSSSGANQILISPAYYDHDAVEGPATSPTILTDVNRLFNEKERDFVNVSTAGFILPFEHSDDDDDDIEKAKSCPNSRQPLTTFDFDALPLQLPYKKPASNRRGYERRMEMVNATLPAAPEPAMSPITGFISRFQNRCASKRPIQPPYSNYDEELRRHTRSSSFGTSTPPTPTTASEKSVPRTEVTEKMVKKRFRLVKAVPAFAVPLTRILNPVIVRGQWEIVVRSAAMAFIISWVVVGVLLAIPA